MSTPFSIRAYQPSDAPQMAQLYFDSARRLGARRYSADQVAAWAPAPADPQTVAARAADGRTTLVAVDAQARVLAYGDLEPNGHIDHLYCDPDAAGQGVAGALLDDLIAQARASGVPSLHVEASELARGLFTRKGFTVVARRDFEVRGVAIHNYAMRRGLD